MATIKKKSEQWLFLSIWILILLGLGIWNYWPGRVKFQLKPTQILLSEELKPIFSSAGVKEESPQLYTIELRPTAAFLDKMNGSSKQLQLGFNLHGESSVLSGGVVSVRIFPNQSDITVKLKNPKLVAARAIRLFLAH